MKLTVDEIEAIMIDRITEIIKATVELNQDIRNTLLAYNQLAISHYNGRIEALTDIIEKIQMLKNN